MNEQGHLSRREIIKTAGADALAVGAGVQVVEAGRTHATHKTLKILQWRQFCPGL